MLQDFKVPQSNTDNLMQSLNPLGNYRAQKQDETILYTYNLQTHHYMSRVTG